MSDHSHNIPLPQELADNARTKELLKNETFKTQLDKLTQKQANLAIASIVHAGESKKEILKRAGYSDLKGVRAFKKIHGKLGKALLNVGVTEADIVRIIRDGMTARKTKTVTSRIKDKDGNEKLTHEVVDCGPDYKVQKEMMKVVIDLGGYAPTGKLEVSHKHEYSMSKAVDNLIEREKQLMGGEVDAEFEIVNGEETVN